MKKIAIIEIYSHHVFVDTLSSVLANAGFELDVYVSKKIYEEGGPLFKKNNPNINFYVSNSNESDFSFLKRIRPIIENENDLVILNSVQGFKILLFYLLPFKINTIAAAGRISEFFNKEYKLLGFKTLRDFIYYNFTVVFLNRIISRLKGIIVHTEQAKNYAISNGYKLPIHKMPFALNLAEKQFLSDKKSDQNINFIVTGAIENISRDIGGMLDAFESIWKKNINNISLIVLSRPKGSFGESILERMKKIKQEGNPIKFYNGWIPEREYNIELQKADFIIAPIRENYYGCGELTSATVESIKYCIPSLYPDWYKPEIELESCSLYFSSRIELSNHIENLSKDMNLLNYYKNNAETNLKKYNIKNETKNIYEFITTNRIL